MVRRSKLRLSPLHVDLLKQGCHHEGDGGATYIFLEKRRVGTGGGPTQNSVMPRIPKHYVRGPRASLTIRLSFEEKNNKSGFAVVV